MRVGTANSLAGRYAAALFDLAESDKTLDAVMEALAGLEALLATSAELKALIGNRLMRRADVGAGLAAVAAELDLPKLVANFLGVLAANGRAALLPDVIRAFRERLASHRGEATAKVIAAHKLTAAQEKALAAKLKARTGRDMALDVTVDPAILGGLIVRLGSEQIDTSVKTRLERLGARMKGLT
ncbi:F0F1 ATP synthase subunit delta [Thermaurantiacus sp.]